MDLAAVLKKARHGGEGRKESGIRNQSVSPRALLSPTGTISGSDTICERSKTLIVGKMLVQQFQPPTVSDPSGVQKEGGERARGCPQCESREHYTES